MLSSCTLRRFFGKNTKQCKTFKNWNILKGDTVYVNTGKDKGKTGEVLKVYRKSNRVIVDGINLKFKRVSNDMDGEAVGGTRPFLAPVHVSNVNLICPETGKPTRVKHGYLEDGTRVRVARSSYAIIPKPDRSELTYEQRTKNKVDGDKDTLAEDVLEVTYKGEDFDLIRMEFDQFIQEKERIEELLPFER